VGVIPIVAGVAVLFLVLVPVLVYNRLVHLRNLVADSWHDIDTELQRRADLVPNLVETVRGYAAHERQVFEAVTAARTEASAVIGGAAAREAPEQALTGGLRRLFAVAEGYPDLKADAQFLELQHQLTDTEDRIQVARRIYNANVRALNTLTQSFPASVIAGSFHIATASYFEIEPAVRDAGPPPVDLAREA
jgi:LemA protein